MSSLYGPFNLSAVQGQKIITQGAYPETLAVVVYNESPYFLNVHIGGGVSLPLPASTADIIPVPPGFNGGITIDAASYLSSQGQAPSTVCFIVGLGSQDALTKLLLAGASTGFPMQLNRLQNLGNLSGVASSQAVVNDGNAVTPWLETTPTGSPGSTWSADTAGNMTVKELNAGVLTQIFKLIVGTGVQLGASNRTTEVLGNLLADASIILNNNQQIQAKDHLGNIRGIIATDTSDDLNIFGLSGRDIIQLISSGSVVQFIIDLVNGIIKPQMGGITVNGSTSGTVTLYQIFGGSAFKLVYIKWNNYQQGAATEQTITLPVPFAFKAIAISGLTKQITPYLSGSALTNSVRNLTGLGTGGGGSTTIQNSHPNTSLSFITSSFDALGFSANDVSSATDGTIIFGQ